MRLALLPCHRLLEPCPSPEVIDDGQDSRGAGVEGPGWPFLGYQRSVPTGEGAQPSPRPFHDAEERRQLVHQVRRQRAQVLQRPAVQTQRGKFHGPGLL